MQSKEQIIKAVEDYSQFDPTILGDLLQYIGRKWEETRKAEASRRDSQHRGALAEMVDNLWAIALYRKKNAKLWSNLECCTLLDACAVVMVNGKGSSEAQRAVARHLAASCRALGWKPKDDFIRNIRKQEEFLAALYEQHPQEQAA